MERVSCQGSLHTTPFTWYLQRYVLLFSSFTNTSPDMHGSFGLYKDKKKKTLRLQYKASVHAFILLTYTLWFRSWSLFYNRRDNGLLFGWSFHLVKITSSELSPTYSCAHAGLFTLLASHCCEMSIPRKFCTVQCFSRRWNSHGC